MFPARGQAGHPPTRGLAWSHEAWQFAGVGEVTGPFSSEPVNRYGDRLGRDDREVAAGLQSVGEGIVRRVLRRDAVDAACGHSIIRTPFGRSYEPLAGNLFRLSPSLVEVLLRYRIFMRAAGTGIIRIGTKCPASLKNPNLSRGL